MLNVHTYVFALVDCGLVFVAALAQNKEDEEAPPCALSSMTCPANEGWFFFFNSVLGGVKFGGFAGHTMDNCSN